MDGQQYIYTAGATVCMIDDSKKASATTYKLVKPCSDHAAK
jgi:hypothetical protein